MTEGEWLASEDAAAMLDWGLMKHAGAGPQIGRPGFTARKLRLFACAVARVLAREPKNFHMYTPAERDAMIAAVEAHADGLGPMPEATACYLTHGEALIVAQYAAGLSRTPYPGLPALLRDIAGNPFRPVTFQRLVFASYHKVEECNSLALAAYQERLPDGALDPVRLAVLADALEDVGCDNEELLRHLREGERARRLVPVNDGYPPMVAYDQAPHVRGCWAVDCILGKS